MTFITKYLTNLASRIYIYMYAIPLQSVRRSTTESRVSAGYYMVSTQVTRSRFKQSKSCSSHILTFRAFLNILVVLGIFEDE